MYNKNELIETIVHDLKSPLTVLKGTIEYLSYELEQDELNNESKKAIKTIKRSTRNLEDMINTILNSSINEETYSHIEPKNIKNLSYTLKEYCNEFKYKMKSKKINFKTYIQKNLPEVALDMKKVKNHILNNIITNAIKFTLKDGTIKVSAFEDEYDLLIVVEDSGVGVAQKDRENIFKKKFQIKKGAQNPKSHGLGLYNAMHFARLHGGTINVSRSIYNKGTAFTIRFPKLRSDFDK